MPVSVIGYEASNSIVELNTTELDKLSYYVLEYMINSGDFASTLTANTASTGNLIGTFVDTARVGDEYESNITIVSNSTNLYQSNTQTFTTVPIYMTVGLDTAVSGTVVLEENKTTLSALGQEIFDRYTSNGPGTYYLGVTAPVDGGTWGYDYFIDDTLFNFTIQNARYFLWKKLEQNYMGTHVEPLKLSSNVLTRFSDAEIKQLAYYVENIFLTTGVGQYILQTSPPAYGTWVNQGTITDIRRQETTGDFEGPPYNADYISTYEGILEASYDSPAITFSGYVGFGSFINPDEVVFSGTYTDSFASTFAGYTRNYVENRVVSYLGPGISYEGDLGPEYDGILVALTNYDGFTNATYEGVGFIGYIIPYLATYNVPYDIGFISTFTSNFDDIVNIYVGDFASNFIGLFDSTTFNSAFTNFQNVDEINFTITYTGNFASSFAGYQRNYVEEAGGTGNYLGPGPAYAGVTGYIATFEGTYEGSFSSSFTATYEGSFDSSYTSTYIGSFSGSNYQANYEGVGFTSYDGTAPSVYEGDSTIGYLGPTAGFTAFNADFLSGFQDLYSGPAVSELTETVTTLTLWRRVA